MRAEKTEVYKHLELVHNLESPSRIVRKLMDTIRPQSVLDVGCGIGTFLHCFKEHGVENITGIDGDWVNDQLRRKYLSDDEFRVHDLKKEFSLGNRFDLVVCLEVAEHLPGSIADLLVRNLVTHGDIILFSAAIPGQKGQNHINEQWPDYWKEKFSVHGYSFHDVIRPMIWNDPDIFFWYKQNTFLVTRDSVDFDRTVFAEHQQQIWNMVHPEQFNKCSEEQKEIVSGKRMVRFYWNLFIRSILMRF